MRTGYKRREGAEPSPATWLNLSPWRDRGRNVLLAAGAGWELSGAAGTCRPCPGFSGARGSLPAVGMPQRHVSVLLSKCGASSVCKQGTGGENRAARPGLGLSLTGIRPSWPLRGFVNRCGAGLLTGHFGVRSQLKLYIWWLSERVQCGKTPFLTLHTIPRCPCEVFYDYFCCCCFTKKALYYVHRQENRSSMAMQSPSAPSYSVTASSAALVAKITKRCSVLRAC